VLAVVTNIDADHMETYEHSLDKLRQAFVDFLQHLPFYGVAVLCADDANVRAVMSQITKPMVTYGLAADAHVRALDVAPNGTQMRFRAVLAGGGRSGGVELPITLNLPGAHNVRNALAAIAVGAELGVPEAAIVKALAEFKGVGRRFQRHGKIRLAGGGSFALVDDYGHHPAEMAATLAAARGAYPGRRILLAFQPHRYTRTRDCFEDFVKVLSTADALVLTEVYPAGEAPIVAADGKALARAIRVQGRIEPVFVEKVAELPAAILGLARDGDVVLTMGAGSIGNVPAVLVNRPRNVNDAA
jgi:UDP-N-acetylmuramate--alanine ligase